MIDDVVMIFVNGMVFDCDMIVVMFNDLLLWDVYELIDEWFVLVSDDVVVLVY